MKTEVTMPPNTPSATMPPAAHPANDAEPRIAPASVRLRRLHAQTWTGVSAERFEMHAADRSLIELPSDTMVLNEVGGRAELVVVLNNDAFGFMELEQKSTDFPPVGTELRHPNFAAMAEATGVRGIRLEDPKDVEAGIKAAPAHDGPVPVDAVVNRTELAMPPAITLEMAKGFTLYMVKAMMHGRGDELVDLAVSNLWV
jgi:pyruvate dehydrogenase (quinone)